MAKGFKKGVGGVNPLNFKVVGATSEPANPTENMIWVNMSTPYANCYFSNTRPENPVAGTVWFGIGINSKVGFNALKKDTIMVYPVTVQRFTTGVTESGLEYTDWSAKEAKIYQNGKWVDFATYLYNQGDDCDSITGGWAAYAYAHYIQYLDDRKAPTLNTSGSVMKITFPAAGAGSSTSGTTWYRGSVFTENAIDLTNVNTITFVVDAFEGGDSSVSGTNVTDYLQIVTSKSDKYTVAASASITEAGEYCIDVSGLSGSYYVAVSNLKNYTAHTVEISKIRLD